jgi:MFS family permease
MFENHLHLMFQLDGLTTMISTILIIIFVKALDVSQFSEEDKNEYEDHEDADKKVFAVLKERRPVMIQIMMFVMVAMIYDQWSFVIPLYLEEIFASDGARYFGLLASFNGFVVILFTPVLTRVLHKIDEMPKMIMGVLLYSLSYLLIRDTAVYLVFFVMMTAFTVGEVVNLLGSSTYVSRRVPSSHRGRINSIRGIGGFLGAVSGRVIIGILIDSYSYAVAFTFLSALGIVSAIIITFNYRLDKKTFPKLYNQIPIDKVS